MRSWGGKCVMSSPKKRMMPDDGGKSPVMQLKSVVLPAPFEPSTARRSPGRTVMVTSVKAASAPNSRVTPRSSSAASAPTTERRWATLTMALRSASCAGTAMLSPPVPKADHAVRGPEHDGEEAEPDQQTKTVAIETDLHEKIEREGAQEDKYKRANEGADRPRDAADDGDDQNVDGALDADRARRNLVVVPNLQNPGQRREE